MICSAFFRFHGAPSMSPRLNRILLKLERAKQHILELEDGLNAFRLSRPYQPITNFNPNSGKTVYNIRVVAAPPESLSLIIGDAIHNLRSALDHLVWQLIESNGNIPTKRSAFPIYETSAKYKTGSATQIEGMTAAARCLIDATNPYVGGTDDLWILHEIDIVDKHRLLLVVGYGLATASVTLSTGSANSAKICFDIPMQGVMLNDGAELGSVTGPIDPKLKQDFDFSFDIAFAEPEIVKGKAVLVVLKELSHLVDGIVRQFVIYL